MAFEKPNEAKLLELINRTGYKMLQENGQRRFGPSRNRDSTTPPKGCEVFVGRIPRDCFEDELFPIFEKAGSVYEMRLMMDFSGSNRGYAFVMYNSRESARRAVMELDNYEIRRGKHIGVCMSVDNCRLFVGGIPKTRTREEIMAEMRRLTDGVVDVIVYPSAHDRQRNRGFAFVEYATHRDAAMARRKLIPGRIQFFGQSIAVDWAEPERNVDDDVMRTVRVLYVRNLPSDYDETRIRQLFVEAVGSEIEQAVERVRRIGNYAFVHFTTREHAEQARAALHGRQLITASDNTAPSQLSGENLQMPLEVVFAKPPTRSCGRRGATSDSIGNSNPSRRNANAERDMDTKGTEGAGCKASHVSRKSTRRAGDHASAHASSARGAAGTRSNAVRRVGTIVQAENHVPYASTVEQNDPSAPVACSAVAPASYYSYAPPSMHATSYFLPSATTDYRIFRDASAPLRASVPLPDAATSGYASLTNANAYGAAANSYSTAHNGYLSGATNYVSLSVNQPTGFVNAATGYVNGAGYATAMPNGTGYGGPSQAINFAAAFNTNSNAAPSGSAMYANPTLPLGTDPALVHQRSAIAGGVNAQQAALYSPFAAASTTALHGMPLSGLSAIPHYAIAAKPKTNIMNSAEQDGNNQPGTVLLSAVNINVPNTRDAHLTKNCLNGAQLVKAPNQPLERVNTTIQQRGVPNAHFSNMLNGLTGVVQPNGAQTQGNVAVESHNTAALVSTTSRS